MKCTHYPKHRPPAWATEVTEFQFDRNLARLSAAEPYFAPNFTAARPLLDSAKSSGDGLTFPSGAVCGAHGCTCGDTGCLHRVAWRIYAQELR